MALDASLCTSQQIVSQAAVVAHAAASAGFVFQEAVVLVAHRVADCCRRMAGVGRLLLRLALLL